MEKLCKDSYFSEFNAYFLLALHLYYFIFYLRSKFYAYHMIQRIQSIYLLLAAGAYGSDFALPYLTTTTTDPATAIPQMSDGVFNVFDNIGLMGLAGLGLAISFGAIFLFKNRQLQGKLTALGMFSGILMVLLAGLAYQGVQKNMPAGGSVSFGAAWVTPLVAILFLWLAGKAIKKDEKLVRSMDRLR